MDISKSATSSANPVSATSAPARPQRTADNAAQQRQESVVVNISDKAQQLYRADNQKNAERSEAAAKESSASARVRSAETAQSQSAEAAKAQQAQSARSQQAQSANKGTHINAIA